jgi:alkylation response protein AidB-like acyl-CoA dehydrogenase
MAEMYVLVETSRSTCYAAAWEAASGGDALAEHAITAKVHCCEAFQAITAEMIQLHGGIAITWEHDAHFYFKRAHGSAHLFGHPADHVSRLAALVDI